MFSTLTKPFAAYLATVLLMVFGSLTGCQVADPAGEGEPNPAAINQDDSRMQVNVPMSSIQDYRLPPQSVQDLVNRSQAIVIGVISAISEVKREIPYDITEQEFAKKFADVPEELRPYLEVVYYDIAIEEVLLDDGNVRAHPRLRLEPYSPLPRLGQRYLFTMGRNPDSLSYGVAADWMTLTLGDNGIRNLDGSSPGYVGVTNEASLTAAIREAVPHYDFLRVNQWPSRFEVNEGDDAETAPPPGGPGGDDAGSVGDGGAGVAGDGRGFYRTLAGGDGVSVATIFREPQDVQELVNRSHAIVIGAVSAISGTAQELPYGTSEDDFDPMELSFRYSGVTYYDIAVEAVLLDDGNVRAYPRLRLDGAHNPMYPQIGERFLFALGRNPDSLSYGIAADWEMLPLDGGAIRNFDGTSPGYAGVSDEASLVQAIKDAVANYDFMPPSRWPSRFAGGDGDGGNAAADGG